MPEPNKAPQFGHYGGTNRSAFGSGPRHTDGAQAFVAAPALESQAADDADEPMVATTLALI